MLTKDCYELYKADADLLALYGAKDALLTLQLFYHMVPILYEEGLDAFFYDDETMPLLRGPTYDLNTVGLKVDPDKLQALRLSLEAECLEDKAYIYKEVFAHVKDKYPGTNKGNTFNIGATQQLAWLLFEHLENLFGTITKSGKEMCLATGLTVPYKNSDKFAFIKACKARKGQVWAEPAYNYKTKKMGQAKKIKDPWVYMQCGKETFKLLGKKYKWVERLLKYNANLKILNTYVEGIQEKARYNVIRPSFLQHGTTSGRYSSKKPNFQNLPKNDKRVKSCIISRPGKSFIGADYEQLEPRVFASFSGDERLLKSFKDGDDFYSVVGAEVFNKKGVGLKKDEPGSFSVLHPKLRDISKVVTLSSTYGTTAPKMALTLGCDMDEAQHQIDAFFLTFPNVHKLMLSSHEEVKANGRVVNLFGRPRRLPEALEISKIYGKNVKHGKLPYNIRKLLNLAINHKIQSTGASIMNRAAIAVKQAIKNLAAIDPLWNEVKIVLQVHDELILEGPDSIAEDAAIVLKDCMENTVILPGVDLIAKPKIAKSLDALK